MEETMRDDWGVVYSGERPEALRDALRIVFAHGRYFADGEKTRVRYYEERDGELWLYGGREKPEATTALPGALDCEGTAVMILSWLEDHEPPGEHPDTDGTYKKGYRLFTRRGTWDSDPIVCVKSLWFVYGK